MKKYVVLILVSALWIVSCTKKTEKTVSLDTHVATLNFTVSGGENVSSFNVYNNENLVMQLAQSSTSHPGQYTVQLDDIPHDPYNLNFEIEPMFVDANGSDINLEMSILINKEEVATAAQASLQYGETANLAYTSK